jgi:alkylmercury lyase-like protein
MDFDALLRHRIYTHVTRRGNPPTIAELCASTGAAPDGVRESLGRLAAGRILVLQRDSGEILMAPPFSAVPTPFLVETSRHTCYANCAWDAIGVPIMLREPARLVSSCGCCGAALTLEVQPDRPPSARDVVHFAVPAARWWQDLVYT